MKISSASGAIASQAAAPHQAEVPKLPFYQAFSPSRGDLIFGLSTVTQSYERYPSWTPARVLERLLVIFNLIPEQPDAFQFIGMTAPNLKTTGEKMQQSLATHLERAAKKVTVIDETTRATDTKKIMALIVNALKPEGLNKHLGISHEKASIVRHAIMTDDASSFLKIAPEVNENRATKFIGGIRYYMDHIDETRNDFNNDIRKIFSGSSNTFTMNTLERLFESMERHPRYAPAWSLMEASASDEKNLASDERNRLVHDFGQLVFDRMSKAMIDTIVSQESEHPIQPGKDRARIHFMLDEVEMRAIVNKDPINGLGTTAKEIRYLYRIKERLGDMVIFYKNGQAVAPPWEEEPLLWQSYTPSSTNAILPTVRSGQHHAG